MRSWYAAFGTVALLCALAAWLLPQDAPKHRADGAPVEIYLVADAKGVHGLRRAFGDARIAVDHPEAIALQDGRIFAAGHSAASEIANAAGWAGRELRIVSGRGPDGDVPKRGRAAEPRPAPTAASLHAWGLGIAGIAGVAALLALAWPLVRVRAHRALGIAPSARSDHV